MTNDIPFSGAAKPRSPRSSCEVVVATDNYDPFGIASWGGSRMPQLLGVCDDPQQDGLAIRAGQVAGDGPAADAGDDTLKRLFVEWCDRRCAPGTGPDDSPTDDELADLLDIIQGVRATGTVGMAIKVYLLGIDQSPPSRRASGPLVLEGFISGNDFNENYSAFGRLFDERQLLRSLLIDAAQFLPELAPLIAEVAASPLQLDEADRQEPAGQVFDRLAALQERVAAAMAEHSGSLLPGDRGLVQAEQRQRALESAITEISREFDVTCDEEDQFLRPTLHEAEDEAWLHMRDTEAESLVGVAVKLRWLRKQDECNQTVFDECLDLLRCSDQ